MRCSILRRSLPVCTLAFAAALAQAQSDAPAPAAAASKWIDPVNAPAEIQPLAAQSLLLDITQSAGHYLAVGSRGGVLVSDDGRAWRQVVAPTRATLTAVTAIDAQVWAVGHDGVILHSADGGEHWLMQRQDPLKTGAGEAEHDPQQGAPLLDVLFLDTHRGFAIGAYSLALTTSDGGEHWEPITVSKAGAAVDAQNDKSAKGDKQTFSKEELKVGQEATPHLNAIARTGSGALLMVAERGSAFRSRDGGVTWQRLQLPYDGSMFGVLGYEGDHVLAFGLRGHVFESNDLGEHWEAVATGTEFSLMGGAALPNGGAVIVGANGIVLSRAKAGEALQSAVNEASGIIAAVLPLATGSDVLLVGENGVSIFQRK